LKKIAVPHDLILEHQPTLAHREAIFWLLESFNYSQAGPEPELPLAILIREDGCDKIIGGLWGITYYRWMFVELLFVPQELRGKGFGKKMMAKAEAEAERRGCHGSWIDTFTFQACGFYEKLGYKIFGELRSYPPGHSRIFMCKWLAPERIPNDGPNATNERSVTGGSFPQAR
jgi:GNAT superfamily N-acetyltransferase